MAGFCVNGDEPYGHIKAGNFLRLVRLSCKTVILTVVLYVFETWSVILRDELG